MSSCGFPIICDYLSKQAWPQSRLTGVEVTHIWTQDPVLSQHIAAASLIPHVVDDPADMLNEIDALLLARDDAENHWTFASPFLQQGIPVYIDKPIALTQANLERLYREVQYEGQIFTCSALRYARELMLTADEHTRLGRIMHIHAVVPNSWEKYAVHAIEPLLNIIDSSSTVRHISTRTIAHNGRTVSLTFENQCTVDITALGQHVVAPIALRLYGQNGWHDLTFSDSFSAFKSALNDFVNGVHTKTCKSPKAFNARVVSIIEMGLVT